MKPLVQPIQYSGVYPVGWGGYTWLDYDPQAGSYHPADDYNWGASGDADLGLPVSAISKGTVVYSADQEVNYGHMIVIRHDLDAETRKFIKDNFGFDVPVLYSLYAHLLQRQVALGNVVEAGALIGKCGKSGVQYAHLHCEIYRGDLDLANEPWRFYPIGWSEAKIKRNWLPPFLVIEKSKTVVTPPPVSPYKAKDEILKIAVNRVNIELGNDLTNPNADYQAIYNSTIAKVKKIADTGTL